ncbi:MAG: SDR family oxidoreductase [Burkholderiales bacterium]|nr:SDR family oxidoreductase [Burkholderiales bacterium]
MNVLVCGASGCVGRAVVQALRWRGHRVVESGRDRASASDSMALDFMRARTPGDWAADLRARRIDAVVNCVGILMTSSTASFERVHTEGPIELFRGAALAGVGRIVQVSALGVAETAEAGETGYLRSKRLADQALLALDVDAAIVRPSLLFGPGSASAALFATLASLPVIGLPGQGGQRVQPIHVFELAEIIAGLVERSGSARGVYELGGKEALDYRQMLAAYRAAQGLGEAIWLPLPMPLMLLGARVAEWVPQRVFSRDTLRMLERGNVPARNAAPALLGRAPSGLAEGLAVAPPKPMFSARVELAPPVELGLRMALAFLWIYTAAISAWLPERSGVLELLARCGFAGTAGQAALVASCMLNLTLGTLTLLRPSVLLYALQGAAVVGYTLTAAFNVPELTIDHCGPLVKNLPVLGCVLVLWLAEAGRASPRRRALAARPVAARPWRPSPPLRPATRDVPA